MRCALAALLVLLAGCRAPAILAAGEHSTRATVLRVPFAAQAGHGDGGVACVGLLLRYHGAELDLEAQGRFPEETLAVVTATELRDYLRGRGFAAEVLGGDLSDRLPRGLRGYIERGHPVIVALEDRFVLVHGFDPVARRVYAFDPLSGPRELDADAFDALWRPTGRLLLAAVPAPRF